MLADVAEQAMLDRIPLGGTGGIMANGDAELVGIDQTFQAQQRAPLLPPRPRSATREHGITTTVLLAPAPRNGIDGESWSIVGHAHHDHPPVSLQIIDPIGNRHTLTWERKSWSWTRIGSRLHTRPLFLNCPTNSFFLVSTLMMGSRSGERVPLLVERNRRRTVTLKVREVTGRRPCSWQR